MLLILFLTFSNGFLTSLSCVFTFQVNLRKEFAPGMGGSDTCHFCKKRVYVMERLSAEGYFFHRECFRCEVCSATLRLGGQVFDQGITRVLLIRQACEVKRQQMHRSRNGSFPGDSVDSYLHQMCFSYYLL